MKSMIRMFTLLVLVSFPFSAMAECQVDADCNENEICALSDCKACPDEEECPPCEPEGVCIQVGAEGQDCDTNQDCPSGYECLPMPCPGCACPPCDPDDEGNCPECDCPPCDGGGECVELWDDDPDDWYGGECDNDADCPEYFTCKDIQVPCPTMPDCPPCTCAAPGCNPDEGDCSEAPEPDCECEPCDIPEDFECETETYGYCVFEPEDCSSDDDCGEGFECIEQEACWESGGGGCVCTTCACPDCPEGEECEPCDCPEEEECECFDDEPQSGCESMGAFCVPKQIECEDDLNCPEGWECAQFGSSGGGTSCACACECQATPPCAPGEECPEPEECVCPPCDCDEEGEEFAEPGIGFCIPGGWKDIGFDDGETLGGSNFIEKGVSSAASDSPHSPEADPNGQGNGEGGGNEETPSDTSGGNDDGGSTGCSTGSTGGGAPFGILFAFLALGLAVTRRKSAVRS